MVDFVGVQIDQFVYGLYEMAAVMLWFVVKGFLWASYYLMELTSWVTGSVLAPLIDTTFNITGGMLAGIVMIAFLLLGIGYLLAIFGDFHVVDANSGFKWLIVAVVIFSAGPNLYLGIESFRRSWGSAFYESGLDQVVSAESSIGGSANLSSDTSIHVDPISNRMALFSPADQWIDGTDVVFAFTLSDPCDMFLSHGACGAQASLRAACVVYTLTTCELPWKWYTDADGYFLETRHATTFPFLTPEQRDESLTAAQRGIQILVTAIPMALFALVEQLINFLLAISMGIAYLSLGVAVLFSFFKRTEPISLSVFNLIVELFVQSVATSLVLSVVVTILVVSTSFGNGALMIGASIIGLVMVLALLRAAMTALVGSVNRMFGAMSTATGNVIPKFTDTASGLAGAVGATAGAGIVLGRGGSAAQAAGMLLSGNQTLTNAARNASYLFDESSAMGQLSNDFYSGAAAGNLMGPVGAAIMPVGEGSRRNRRGAAFDEEGNPLRRADDDEGGGSDGGGGDSGGGLPSPSYREDLGIKTNNSIQTAGKVNAVRPRNNETAFVDPNEDGVGVAALSELPASFPLNAVDNVVFKEGRRPDNLYSGSMINRDDLEEFTTADGYAYSSERENPLGTMSRRTSDMQSFNDAIETADFRENHPNLRYSSSSPDGTGAEYFATRAEGEASLPLLSSAENSTVASMMAMDLMNADPLGIGTVPASVAAPQAMDAAPSSSYEPPPMSDDDAYYEEQASRGYDDYGDYGSYGDYDDFSQGDAVELVDQMQGAFPAGFAASAPAAPVYSEEVAQQAVNVAGNLMADPSMYAPGSPQANVYEAASRLGMDETTTRQAMSDVVSTGEISDKTATEIVLGAPPSASAGSSIGSLDGEVANLRSSLNQLAMSINTAASSVQSVQSSAQSSPAPSAAVGPSPVAMAAASSGGDLGNLAASSGTEGSSVSTGPSRRQQRLNRERNSAANSAATGSEPLI